MKKYKLLDLFCGAGGAGMGYFRAGFIVTGIDSQQQPRYPFEFCQMDAFEFLEDHGSEFDVIHASPPCQAYSQLKGLSSKKHPRLIPKIRKLLIQINKPWVIENVMGAELINPIKLCGSSFGLGVRRHRLFEMSNPPILVPPCAHYLQPKPIDVTGTGGPFLGIRKKPGGGVSRKPRNIAEAQKAMGINWMTRKELNEAIPPAYTEWIGKQIIKTFNPPQGG